METGDNSNSNNQGSGLGLLTYLFISFFILLSGYMIYDNIYKWLKPKDSKSSLLFTPEQLDSLVEHKAFQDSLQAVRIAEREKEDSIRRIRNTSSTIEKQQRQVETAANIGSYVQSVYSSYNQLLGFKSNQSFHQFGFGRGGPYHQWLENVENILVDPRARELYNRYGFGVFNLKQLGLEYVNTQGRENDFTRTVNGRFSRLFREFNMN